MQYGLLTSDELNEYFKAVAGEEWYKYRDYMKHRFTSIGEKIKKTTLLKRILDRYKTPFDPKTVASVIQDHVKMGSLIEEDGLVRISKTEDIQKRDEQILKNRINQNQ